MKNKQEIKCIVIGKVQMVMFRDFVERKARSLGITGTVENLEDGTVRVVAQGREDDLKTLINHLHKGPFLARVADVRVKWREPTEQFSDFKIVYGS